MQWEAQLSFREEKTAQVAARLLANAGGRMNYMKLLKLMYFVEREGLVRWAASITCDTYASLPHGPVLSRTCDLLRGEPIPGLDSYWHQHIQSVDRYDVRLLGAAPNDLLSPAEESLVDEIWEKYRGLDQFEIATESERLPEWVNPGKSSFPISLSTILRSAGYSPEDIRDIEEHIRADNDADNLCS